MVQAGDGFPDQRHDGGSNDRAVRVSQAADDDGDQEVEAHRQVEGVAAHVAVLVREEEAADPRQHGASRKDCRPPQRDVETDGPGETLALPDRLEVAAPERAHDVIVDELDKEQDTQDDPEKGGVPPRGIAEMQLRHPEDAHRAPGQRHPPLGQYLDDEAEGEGRHRQVERTGPQRHETDHHPGKQGRRYPGGNRYPEGIPARGGDDRGSVRPDSVEAGLPEGELP
jgi:hypothetical protein